MADKYAQYMRTGIKYSGLTSSWTWGKGNPYDESAITWAFGSIVGNPAIATIRESQRQAEWQSEGRSEAEIKQLAMGKSMLDASLSPVDVSGLRNAIDNCFTSDDLIKAATSFTLGKVVSNRVSKANATAQRKGEISSSATSSAAKQKISSSNSEKSKIEKSADTTYEGVSRRDALRAAKRDAHVPNSTQPTKVVKYPLIEGYGKNRHQVKDSKGKNIYTREYEYKNIEGKTVYIQEHSLGHDDAKPMKGAEPHFNIRPQKERLEEDEKIKKGNMPETHGHYNFETED